MCDTFVALADTSALDSVILAKNSDRPAFDCQPLAYHEGQTYGKGEKIELAYVTIDQAEKTYTSFGSSPYWCWGYEEGMNEFGVTIGNEAVYTKDLTENTEAEKAGNPVDKGILGMELLRLGLERGKTAAEALEVMTALIEQYGQWGSGVPMSNTVDGSYNNSYIIADKKEAYILETAGKRWAARRVEKGYAAISNEISIRKDMTSCCGDLVDYAIERGWWPEEKRQAFDFAEAYINQLNPRQLSHIRVQRARQLLSEGAKKDEKIGVDWMKRILRDHYEDTFLEGPYFNASSPDFLTICMHDSPAGFTWGNTASSMIAVLPDDDNKLPVMWWAPAVPCCSIYIPFFIDAKGLPDYVQRAGTYGKTMCAPSDVEREDTYQEGSFWWDIRALLDKINGDENGTTYNQRHAIVRSLFDELESQWLVEVDAVQVKAAELKRAGNDKDAAAMLYQYTQKCIEQARAAISTAEAMFEVL